MAGHAISLGFCLGFVRDKQNGKRGVIGRDPGEIKALAKFFVRRKATPDKWTILLTHYAGPAEIRRHRLSAIADQKRERARSEVAMADEGRAAIGVEFKLHGGR
jgi:hypothetical protein